MYLINYSLQRWQVNTIYSCIFSTKKRKKKFIPLSWKIGDFIFRNINKVDEFVNHLKNVNLKYAEKIKGVDHKKIFAEHML
jgi:predicted molibdopterin-dependent oxidoreductase YjgC